VPCVTVPCVTVPCTWNERCTEFVYADYTVFATSELWKDTIFLKHKYVWNGVENDSTNTKEYHNVHKATVIIAKLRWSGFYTMPTYFPP